MKLHIVLIAAFFMASFLASGKGYSNVSSVEIERGKCPANFDFGQNFFEAQKPITVPAMSKASLNYAEEYGTSYGLASEIPFLAMQTQFSLKLFLVLDDSHKNLPSSGCYYKAEKFELTYKYPQQPGFVSTLGPRLVNEASLVTTKDDFFAKLTVNNAKNQKFMTLYFNMKAPLFDGFIPVDSYIDDKSLESRFSILVDFNAPVYSAPDPSEGIFKSRMMGFKAIFSQVRTGESWGETYSQYRDISSILFNLLNYK